VRPRDLLSVTNLQFVVLGIGLWGKNTKRDKIEIKGKIIEQVSNFNYLGNPISNEGKDIDTKLQEYN
jgi:hypothetical protein